MTTAGTTTRDLRRVVLHVADDDGRLLEVTEYMTGDRVPYEIMKVKENRRGKFSDCKKLIFQRETDRQKHPLLARFFGEFLSASEEILVRGVGGPPKSSNVARSLISCSYKFPAGGTRTTLPMNFDYATCRLAIPVSVPAENSAKAANVVRRVAEESRADLGHGHSGLTKREGDLAVLSDRAWDDVVDDVVATPYRDNYADDWFPVLREDGRAGLYRSVAGKTNGGDTYVVVENALPHFACDQMRILFAKNSEKLSWKGWTGTAIVDRAIDLSRAVAEAVASRVVAELEKERLITTTTRGGGGEKVCVFVNRLNKLTNGEVRYDAGVLRGTFFSKTNRKCPKALIRVGDDDYAILEQFGHAPRETDVFPAATNDLDDLIDLVDDVNLTIDAKVYHPPVLLKKVDAVTDATGDTI